MVLLIDNYDSFVYNLARYVRELQATAEVVRNDRVTLDQVRALRPTHIILSPGPCTPAEAGISTEVVRTLGPEIPILGVCLGHQCIGAAFGARIVRARHPTHGKASPVRHDGSGVLRGLSNPLRTGRYHSLAVARDGLPGELVVNGATEDGEIMALRHRDYPVHGVQFHPESVLTPEGHALIRNFLELAG